MQLSDGKGVLVENPERLDGLKFVGLVLGEFPQLTEEFAEEAGLLHLQTAALSRFAQVAMDGGDLDTLRRCYALLAEVMRSCTFEVENAIYVSFLENLDFEGRTNGAEARRLLPPVLAQALAELESHWRRFGEWQVEAQANQQRVREERERKLRRRI